MSSRSSHISFALLVWFLSLFTLACHNKNGPTPPFEQTDDLGTIVFLTDSDEWHVRLFAEHLIYSKAVEVNLPSPWMLPTREDAQILKTFTYPHDERFITSDGYTFGMPSASVSKAGQKTYYSVLVLWKRRTVIVVEF